MNFKNNNLKIIKSLGNNKNLLKTMKILVKFLL